MGKEIGRDDLDGERKVFFLGSKAKSWVQCTWKSWDLNLKFGKSEDISILDYSLVRS